MTLGPVRRSLRLQVESWAAGFEPSVRSARFWVRTVAASSAATVALVALAAFTPGLREFFGLQPAVPLTLIALRGAGHLAFAHFERRRGWSAGYFAVAALSMAFGFQLVVSSLVVYSRPPGAFVLAALPLLAAAYSCMILRATPSFPWPPLVHGLAMALALALRPESPQAEIFAVAGPLAVGGGFFLGMLGDTMARARQTLEEHRRAIQAHVLDERTGEAQRLSSSLLELLQRSHDASSAISTALLDADLLSNRVREGGAGAGPPIEAAAASLRSSLLRVGHILGMPEDAGEARPQPEHDTAAVLVTVQAAIEQMARRFPAVRLEPPSYSPRARSACVALRGGAEELERMVAELLKNACEGSGTRRARRVAVEIDAESDPCAVSIRVSDDGPGFPRHVLSASPTAFVTTKPGGTGLGLYTADRVAAANGGSLQLENLPTGGSAVTLRLPRREQGG